MKTELMILAVWSTIMLQSAMLPTSYLTNTGNTNTIYSIKQEETEEGSLDEEILPEETGENFKILLEDEEKEVEEYSLDEEILPEETGKNFKILLEDEEKEVEEGSLDEEILPKETEKNFKILLKDEEKETEEYSFGEKSVPEETEKKFKRLLEDIKKEKEAERLAKEEAERLAREEAERLAKEEAERLAKEEAERLAKEAEEKAKAEAEARKLNIDPATLTFLVNKEYVLPKNYVPELVEPKVNHCQPENSHKRYMRAEAATALEEMFAAAKKDGYDLWVKTAYRSYSNQYVTYTWTLQYRGVEEAVSYHAPAGASEHQTGLAVDIVCEASNYENELIFEKTKEYEWLKNNCYKYGFTLRYLKGKEDITGYSYEPWHYRYVGVELATYLMEHELTLEEYYNALPTTDLFQVPKEYQHLIPKIESKE